MLCFHKYGPIQPDGYQYCSKCNKAMAPPCIHKYGEPIAEFNETRHTNYGKRENHVYVCQCGKCGEIKKFYV